MVGSVYVNGKVKEGGVMGWLNHSVGMHIVGLVRADIWEQLHTLVLSY